MGMTTGTERAGILSTARPGAAAAQRLRDYVTLTKPHIISLLLITTVAPMIVAGGGWPDGARVLWTMLGGYLMAGSANATNMFIDRDIDAVMGRTRLRPIPAGGCLPATCSPSRPSSAPRPSSSSPPASTSSPRSSRSAAGSGTSGCTPSA